MAKLTAKQQRFCDEYLIDLNATQAAIRAGYSEKTAAVIATENLRKPNIKEYIENRLAEKEKELIADQDEVMRYLTAVMRREMKESVVVTLQNKVEKWKGRRNREIEEADCHGRKSGGCGDTCKAIRFKQSCGTTWKALWTVYGEGRSGHSASGVRR